MKNATTSTQDLFQSLDMSGFRSAQDSNERLRPATPEKIDALFSSVGQKLRDGLSGDAESILVKTIGAYAHTPDDLANLKRRPIGDFRSSAQITDQQHIRRCVGGVYVEQDG